MNEEIRELVNEIKRLKSDEMQQLMTRETSLHLTAKQVWGLIVAMVTTALVILGMTRYMIAAEAPWADDKSKVLPAIESNQQSIRQLYNFHDQDHPYQPKVRGRNTQ